MTRSNLRPVNKGDAITADQFNQIIERVNDESEDPKSIPTPRPQKAKGEFWIQNLTGATIPAFSLVGLRGFAGAFASLTSAKTALANDEIVLKTTSASLPFPNNFAFALEGIKAGAVGRAAFANGGLIFGEVAGSAAVAWDARLTTPRAGENYGKWEVDSGGEFLCVAFDPTSRFAAVCAFQRAPIIYQAGQGVSVVDNTISANAYYNWGVWNGSAYTNAGAINCVTGEKLCFGSNFERANRQDDASGGEVRLKTQAMQVVTAVDFANQETTKTWINALV